VLAESVRGPGLEPAQERLAVNHQTDHDVEEVTHLGLVLDRSAEERGFAV
jgi:hypothetical protein